MRKTLIAVGVAFACASFLPVASAGSITIDKTNEQSNTTTYINQDVTGTADDTFTANGTWSSLISVEREREGGVPTRFLVLKTSLPMSTTSTTPVPLIRSLPQEVQHLN